MKSRKLGRLNGSVALMAVALPFGAFAQQSSPASSPSTESTSNQSSSGLEEIIVTAQRHRETAQDVPISISAFSGDRLKATGVSETSGLQSLVPGLDWGRVTNSGLPKLRGIGSSNAAVGDESPIAIYVDDVYRPATIGNLTGLNGIERIEVLKGPQGTLFGRNASGGVIQIITRDPSKTPSLDTDFGYGNYDTVTGSLYATTGVTDVLATNLSVDVTHQGSGWGRNLFNGHDANRTSDLSIRNKWKLTLPQTTVTFSADYVRHETDVGSAIHAYPGTRQIDGQLFSGGFYDVSQDFVSGATSKQWGGSLKIDHDFDWAHVISITAGRRTENSNATFDQDATSLNIIAFTDPSHDQMLSQEFQLVSEAESRIQWLAGLYYFHDVAAYEQFTVSGAGVAPLQQLQHPDGEKTDSYSGFGQASTDIFKDTKLTLGLRYTVDERSFRSQTTLVFAGAPDIVEPTVTAHVRYPKLTYRAALDHKLSRDILVYGSISRGFKSGVFDLVSASPTPVRPEVVDAYEIGFKSEFLDHRVRVNGSAFLNNIGNLQTNAFVAGQGQILLNAGKARTKGFDGELEFAATDHLRLRANGSYLDARFVTYPGAPFFTPNPAPFGGFTPFPNGGNAAGYDIPRSPRYTFSVGGDYTIESSIGQFVLDASLFHNGGYFFEAQNLLRQYPYNLVNSSLSWTAPNKRWRAKLFVSNLLNEHYFSFVTISALGAAVAPDAPRTFGASVGVHF